MVSDKALPPVPLVFTVKGVSFATAWQATTPENNKTASNGNHKLLIAVAPPLMFINNNAFRLKRFIKHVFSININA